MRDIKREKTDDEKIWDKQLVTVASSGHHNECWICDKCKKLYEKDDMIMLWKGVSDPNKTQFHCVKCDKKIAGGTTKYFENNYWFK